MLALRVVHGRNIVHRDIKPANLMLTEAQDIRIADFGLSKMSAEQNALLQTATGTPLYMSPELIDQYQAAKQKRKGRGYSSGVDTWALGCVLIEMVSLTKAFISLKAIATGHIPKVLFIIYLYILVSARFRRLFVFVVRYLVSIMGFFVKSEVSC